MTFIHDVWSMIDVLLLFGLFRDFKQCIAVLNYYEKIYILLSLIKFYSDRVAGVGLFFSVCVPYLIVMFG